jgi:hypothetical protein
LSLEALLLEHLFHLLFVVFDIEIFKMFLLEGVGLECLLILLVLTLIVAVESGESKMWVLGGLMFD